MSRQRFVWDEEKKQLVEIGADWTPTPRTELMTGSCHDGVRAIDGTDISSRAKRKEYMKQNGLADYDDFKGHFAKKRREREAFQTGAPDPARREAIGRAWYQLEQGKRSSKR